MNICVLTHTYPKSKNDTTAAFMRPFVEGLVEAGNNVYLVSPYISGFKINKNKYKTILYKYIWPIKLHSLGYSSAMKADVSLKVANFIFVPFMVIFGTLKLINTIKKYKIDVVNVHWIIPNGLIAYLACKFTKTPYIVTIPGTDAYLVYKNKTYAKIAKLIANSSSGLISNSKILLKRIVDTGITKIPTDIISYPVDTKYFKYSTSGLSLFRERLNIKNSDMVIMAIGRLVYKKGIHYLIKAMPAVIKKFPNIKLVIGGDGDLKQELETQIVKLKLENNVLILGNIQRNEMVNYYNLADVFVAPSIIDNKGNVDGGPVVTYESMACGKPQIVTNILGASEIIKNGVNGYVVPQKDTIALTKAMVKLLSSRKTRENMGRINKELISKTLNTKAVGVRYTQFLKQNCNL